MQHVLNVYSNIIVIDFFGFNINIHKDWYDTHYLSLDLNGRLYIYDAPPVIQERVSGHWMSPNSNDYSALDDLRSYKIPELTNWFETNWDKQYWRVNEFPVLRTA